MMWNVFRRALLVGLPAALPFCLSVPQLRAQAQVETVLQHQLHHIDLAVSGMGIFTGNTSGTAVYNAMSQPLTATPSSTLGALVTLRYTKSPLLGAELNYSRARFNNTYTTTAGDGPPVPTVQSNVSEYTLGYVVHGPALLSFASRRLAQSAPAQQPSRRLPSAARGSASRPAPRTTTPWA